MTFAEYERNIISARTEVGMKAKAEQGYFPAKAPLGYSSDAKSLLKFSLKY